jgi:LPS sulfotransferase NodH
MAQPRIVVILGYQRTGTTAFGELLNSHPDIFCLAEVFHHSYASSKLCELGYFGFVQSLPDCISHVAAPDRRTELFAQYINYLRALTNKPLLAIGVKYDSTHHLDGAWRDILLPPQLFRYLAENGGCILHCIRSNIFLAELSLLRAFQTDVWHIAEGESPPDKKVMVNVGWLLHKIGLHERRRAIFREYIAHLKIPTIDIVYEQMFEEQTGMFASSMCSELSAFLEVKDNFWRNPRQKKVAPANWRDAVSNAAQIEEVLAEKGFAALLADSACE